MTLDFEAVVNLHKDKFGVEPVITGKEFNNSDALVDKIIQAIEDNIPYVEKPVPEGVVT